MYIGEKYATRVVQSPGNGTGGGEGEDVGGRGAGEQRGGGGKFRGTAWMAKTVMSYQMPGNVYFFCRFLV